MNVLVPAEFIRSEECGSGIRVRRRRRWVGFVFLSEYIWVPFDLIFGYHLVSIINGWIDFEEFKSLVKDWFSQWCFLFTFIISRFWKWKLEWEEEEGERKWMQGWKKTIYNVEILSDDDGICYHKSTPWSFSQWWFFFQFAEISTFKTMCWCHNFWPYGH